MALIHLILLLVRLLSKNATAPNAPTQRKTQAGHVTLECPFCHTLGVAPQFNFDRRTASNAWQRHMETYECPNCRRSINAETMRNDGTGVLVVKLWSCPTCRAQIPATRFDCPACGTSLQ
jgi:predicted RNA-binding Zn-ribbon protein involved in translation (DUF1610 family)